MSSPHSVAHNASDDQTRSTERSIAASIAAHTSWSRTRNRSARTAPARAGLRQKFVDQVDPDGTLDPAQREQMAESAMRAHFQRLALRSVRSRRKAKQLLAEAAEAEAELAEAAGVDLTGGAA